MSRFKELLHDRKLMSGIYAVTLVTALLILALVVKGPEESGKLLSDGDGNITGINRRSLNRSESYDLSIEVEDGGEKITRDVTLTLQTGADGRSRSGGPGAPPRGHRPPPASRPRSRRSSAPASRDSACPHSAGSGQDCVLPWPITPLSAGWPPPPPAPRPAPAPESHAAESAAGAGGCAPRRRDSSGTPWPWPARRHDGKR